MPGKLSTLIPLLVAATYVHAEEHRNTDNVAQTLTSFVSAEVLNREHPKYPKAAARRGQSGRVEMTYTVEPDGKVSNIIPTNYSGSRTFIKEATKAVSKWQYSPAMENGKPVQSCLHSVRLDFKIGNGNPEKFSRFYNKSIDILTSGNTEDIARLQGELDAYTTNIVNEREALTLLKFYHASSIQDETLAQSYLAQLDLKTLKNVVPDIWPKLAMNKANLYAKQQKIADALELVNLLLDDTQETFTPLELTEFKNNLIGFQKSDSHLVIQGKVGSLGHWHHNLTRKSFAINRVQGDLESVDVRCDNKRRLYEVNETTLWKLPLEWKNCQVYISGDTDASFELVEYPSLRNDENAVASSD
ncbi:energy transducer TonB [Thalassotalea mangrovi]|uniref:energy transducer TonB n=1 Tax=Thalassotalea mangrovi TaxID=2572245 RepID=UPI00145F5E0E|nr:energy transducer TonB [Thalassotalea mangrovi]